MVWCKGVNSRSGPLRSCRRQRFVPSDAIFAPVYSRLEYNGTRSRLLFFLMADAFIKKEIVVVLLLLLTNTPGSAYPST
jgi:hypothetical protein